jgi:hypothetical protein
MLVLVISFLFLFGISLIFPEIPPGRTICDILGNSQTNYPILGISGEVILAGIINGLVFGVIIAILFSYFRGPPKGKVDLPVWVPRYTTSQNSTTECKSPKRNDNSSFQRLKKSQDIMVVPGIGYRYSDKFKKIGIETIDDLLYASSTKTGRNYLAKNIGVTPSTILRWTHQAKSNR